jgi:DnaJ-domain-containing protein 1
MSIGKRFVRLVRSNLNALLDRTAQWDHLGEVKIEDLSDAELEAELARRQARREAAQRAAHSGDFERDAWEEVEEAVDQGSGRYRTAGRRPSRGSQRSESARRRSATGRDPQLARLYAQLECPYGADMTTVRKHYRQMMRKYHPDMHSGHPEKQRLATELTQKLTSAYNELRRAASGG